MSLITGWATNKGIVRKDNQDSCYINTYENPVCTSAIAILCDGMGGLSDGGLASSIVCNALGKWFDSTYCSNRQIRLLKDKEIISDLNKVLLQANKDLVAYGTKKRIKVGTTASVLFIQNNKYFIIHVGDSRVYRYSSSISQITDDDSVAAEKLRNGKITEPEYEKSNEKHMLTQCIGVNSKLNIHSYSGTVSEGDVFFLCSDGMYHFLKLDELSNMMLAQRKEKGAQITASIERLIDRVISRGEKDNITGVILCSL